MTEMKFDRGNMEATNVLGAGNPSVSFIDAVTLYICGCTATCMRRPIAAATASDLEPYPVPTAQWPEHGPVWITTLARTRRWSKPPIGALNRAPSRFSPRHPSAQHSLLIAVDRKWSCATPPSQNLPITRSASTRCWRLHALPRLPQSARPSSKQAISNATSSCLRTTAFVCH